MRVGIGYDAHKLIPGKGMNLGGIFIECEYSIEAHSDGDVIIHALIDSDYELMEASIADYKLTLSEIILTSCRVKQL